jgi:hypothetical protein
MATKQFAFPLSTGSVQKGDIKFAMLVSANESAEFFLSNAVSGDNNTVNFVTRKLGNRTDHVSAVTFKNGTASVILTHDAMDTILQDGLGGDWDYIEVTWTVGSVDSPATSNMTVQISSGIYNLFGWPPKS